MTTEEKEELHNREDIRIGVSALIDYCHGRAKANGWWTNLQTNQPLDRNNGELFMLMVSEISEAMEGNRKGLMDDKLPHRKMEEVELADLVIRVADYCGARGLDLGGAILEKLDYNDNREDHKPENRLKEGGKKY